MRSWRWKSDSWFTRVRVWTITVTCECKEVVKVLLSNWLWTHPMRMLVQLKGQVRKGNERSACMSRSLTFLLTIFEQYT